MPKRPTLPRVKLPRLIMLSIDVYSEQWPIDVCFRPLPFLAPKYFSKTIRIVEAHHG